MRSGSEKDDRSTMFHPAVLALEDELKQKESERLTIVLLLESPYLSPSIRTSSRKVTCILRKLAPRSFTSS